MDVTVVEEQVYTLKPSQNYGGSEGERSLLS